MIAEEKVELPEHEAELEQVCQLIEAMEPLWGGLPRFVCALALTRSLAAMLAPANPKTREAYIDHLRDLLTKLDAMWQ